MPLVGAFVVDGCSIDSPCPFPSLFIRFSIFSVSLFVSVRVFFSLSSFFCGVGASSLVLLLRWSGGLFACSSFFPRIPLAFFAVVLFRWWSVLGLLYLVSVSLSILIWGFVLPCAFPLFSSFLMMLLCFVDVLLCLQFFALDDSPLLVWGSDFALRFSFCRFRAVASLLHSCFAIGALFLRLHIFLAFHRLSFQFCLYPLLCPLVHQFLFQPAPFVVLVRSRHVPDASSPAPALYIAFVAFSICHVFAHCLFVVFVYSPPLPNGHILVMFSFQFLLSSLLISLSMMCVSCPSWYFRCLFCVALHALLPPLPASLVNFCRIVRIPILLFRHCILVPRSCFLMILFSPALSTYLMIVLDGACVWISFSILLLFPWRICVYSSFLPAQITRHLHYFPHRPILPFSESCFFSASPHISPIVRIS